MIFTEVRFLFFFLAVFSVYWLVGSHRFRKVWLLFASYAFYAAWDWRFLGLIIASTLVDYVVGLRLASSDRARAWIWLSVAVNLGFLAFFKYCNFFLDSGVVFFQWLGLDVQPAVLNIILPVGISFYTFQTMSYSLDIYFKKLEPVRSLLDLAVFVAFFPQLVAGPIVRARDFLPQLAQIKVFARIPFRYASMLFLTGYIKKMCISDALLAGYADQVFADPAKYDAVSTVLGVLCYTVQIYCDFSGYSDMAIACAALLGYKLCDNFNFPYLALNITDFWRRWHMSLSTWLRDYLYIPLGGNRGGALFKARNLMLTMLLGGLWHGAAWTFVVWGALHGAALIVHKLWRVMVGERFKIPRMLVGLPLTLYFTCITWIFFRAETFEKAGILLHSFVLLENAGTRVLPVNLWWVLLILAAAHLIASFKVVEPVLQRAPAWAYSCVIGVLTGIAFTFAASNTQPFIYFQF